MSRGPSGSMSDPFRQKGVIHVTGHLRQKGGTALHEVKHVTGSMSRTPSGVTGRSAKQCLVYLVLVYSWRSLLCACCRCT